MLRGDAPDRIEDSIEGMASMGRRLIVNLPSGPLAMTSRHTAVEASPSCHASCRKGRVTIGFVILAAVGIAVVAMIWIAASVLYPDLAWRQGLAGPSRAVAQVGAPPVVKNDQATLDPAAVRSRLFVLHLKNDKEPRQVVVLGPPALTGDIPDYHLGVRIDMLPREMVRQAVLVAARDELGLPTRDEVIDETHAGQEDGDGGTVEVISFIRDNRSREQVRRVASGRVEALFAHETPTTPGRSLDLVKLLTSAEALSREEFPKVLTSLGLKGKPNSVKEEAGLPEKVEDRLAGLEFVEELIAVRDLHAAISSGGESPARLGRWCVATRCSASSASSSGILRTERSRRLAAIRAAAGRARPERAVGPMASRRSPSRLSGGTATP